jgi:tRNA (cytidine/uridine-2'-O-)-methyltransferase
MLNNKLEVVLYHPQIPQNTGNIGRLCVNTGVRLNLIKPLGFSLEEKYIRRSGLDYWQHLDLKVFECWNDFFSIVERESLFFFSTKTDRLFWECPYKPESNSPAYLVFGSETSGLSEEMYKEFNDRLYTIPMYGIHSRSYNLSNSVSAVLFEGIRKLS